MLGEKPSALVLADMSVAPGPMHDALVDFLNQGGVLIRFAGTRLAAGDDDLTPTALRRGGRTLGGALSWETPKHIAPFEAPSPFVGLVAPDEVTVTRQVLAEPEPGLVDKTWARLADGTPLVTAERRGKGLIVLFHVTADTTWSNLPISGLFVSMLERIVARANATSAAPTASPGKANSAEALSPYRTLDGYGALGAPPADAEPIPATFDQQADAKHPPGFYGEAQALRAVNALALGETLAPADYAGLPRRAGGLETAPPIDLKPWLLLAAFLAFLADTLASLWYSRPRALRGGAPRSIGVALGRACRRGAAAGEGANQRPGGGVADPPRLRADRRCGCRRDDAARPRQARRGPGAADLGQHRRTRRAQPGARRAGFLSADLLADRRRPAAAALDRGRAHRRLHEERRHGRSSTPATR